MKIRTKTESGRRDLGFALVVLVIACGITGSAQEAADYRLSADFLGAFGRDFAAVVTSPLRWNGGDLGRFALVSGATFGTVALDSGIWDWVQEHRTPSSQDVSAFFEKTGDGAYLLGLSAALYAAGEIWDSRGLRKTALLSVESLATASALAAVMKFVTGRARPHTGEDPLTFRMFSTESAYHSFPSGHTTAAFAVATTIAEQAPGAAVDILAYGVATLAGLSRIHDGEHWVSGVLAGGALGYFTGKMISGRHRRSAGAAKSVDFGIQLGPRRQALSLTYVF
jgi:membrane-associated phospholipid phosphatase